MMGYCKAAITFTKYLPQVYLNWKRQSTEGWSIENVALDFAGGSLSFLQSAIKSIFLPDTPFFDTSDGFNVVKFILSVTSMLFDSIFFFQFWLYRNNKPSKPLPELSDLGEEGKGILDEQEHKAIATSNGNTDRNSDWADHAK